MKATENIWRVPVYLPYLQPALTADTVARAEAQLGVKLPQSYLKLLAQQNGGYVRYTLPDTVHSEIWGIGPQFPSITDDEEWRRDDFDADEIWLPPDPKLLIPFDGDSHWYLCFDYRANGPDAEPSVSYLDLECERENPTAPSFDAFVGLLKRDCEDTFGLLGNWTLETAAEALQRTIAKPYVDTGDSDYGYRVLRFDLSDGGNPQWLWLSENAVRRGFVRPKDRRYAELVDLLPGTALRFPEHPEINIIAIISDAVINQVRGACGKASLSLVPFEQ